MESTGLPGVSVVVTQGDRIVHATGAGHDSLGNPVTADTPMRVASVSKSFTAAAVLTLVRDGRMSLDEQVAGLPEGVTVRRLLNQTSGIEDGSVDIARLASASTLAEYVSLLSPAELASEPGTKWAYSNVHYNVAARLVEEAAGRPFDVYLREAVFEPLGMRDSSVGGWAADGHNSLFGWWFSRPELAGGPVVQGSGAVVTTARDMGRWLMAQTGNGPFPEAMLRTMHEPSGVDDYGMGWSPDDDGLLVHSGNLWTYNAIQAIDPKTGYGYAVMTNGAALTDDTGRNPDRPGSPDEGRNPGIPRRLPTTHRSSPGRADVAGVDPGHPGRNPVKALDESPPAPQEFPSRRAPYTRASPAGSPPTCTTRSATSWPSSRCGPAPWSCRRSSGRSTGRPPARCVPRP